MHAFVGHPYHHQRWGEERGCSDHAVVGNAAAPLALREGIADACPAQKKKGAGGSVLIETATVQTPDSRHVVWLERGVVLRLETYLSEYLVPFNALEVAGIIKVQPRQLSPAIHLRAQLAANLHNVLQHLVVAVARK